MAYEIPVTQARAELAELINRVVYGGERVVVTRHGKPLVALVSAADLQRLESEEAEAQEAAAEEQVISSVSSLRSVPSATGERHRFGIAAEHRGHEARARGRPAGPPETTQRRAPPPPGGGTALSGGVPSAREGRFASVTGCHRLLRIRLPAVAAGQHRGQAQYGPRRQDQRRAARRGPVEERDRPQQ